MPVLKYKDGNEWKVASKNVAYEVSDIPAPTADELKLVSKDDHDYSYLNYNGCLDWFINKYKDKISLGTVTYFIQGFYNSGVTAIPFKIQLALGSGTINLASMFYSCKNITTLDNVFVLSGEQTGQVTLSQCFEGAFCLRKIPIEILELSKMDNKNSGANLIFNRGFRSCYCLDEISDLGVPLGTKSMTYNRFNSTFYDCRHLKSMTFVPNQVAEWKNQTIDLLNVGYGYVSSYGFSSTKQIKDDATYQALKDDPDSWTSDINYARYNRTSAVETINSLPDTSAYLATVRGTNTIKFRGNAGAKTDGGAINTMTEEEIAVATAKGWAVSFV